MKLTLLPQVILIALLTNTLSTAGMVSAQGWPPEIKNLKVLPADTQVREVVGTMRDITFALGVRCQYCHLGEEGQPLSEFDFASDQKPTKQTARAMMRMTRAINAKFLAPLEIEGGALEVQCVTCHRGATRPEQLTDLLTRTAVEEGADAAVAKYAAVREESYGSGTFDFRQATLVRSASALLEQGKAEAAVALLKVNLEHFPDSDWTAGTLASAYEQLGDKKQALEILKHMLAKSPDNPRIQQQIKRLENPG